MPKQNNASNAFAKYTGLAIKMLVIIAAFAYVGTLVDDHYPNQYRLGTLILSFLGVGLSLYTTLRDVLREKQ